MKKHFTDKVLEIISVVQITVHCHTMYSLVGRVDCSRFWSVSSELHDIYAGPLTRVSFFISEELLRVTCRVDSDWIRHHV